MSPLNPLNALIFGGPALAGVITTVIAAWIRGRRAHHGRRTRLWWHQTH